MAQQTAVGYIISQLRQLAFNENTHLGMGDVRVTQGLIDELEEQAKQMEKAQIVQSYNDGYKDGQTDPDRSKDISEFSNAKLYYNETFKKL